MRIAVQRHLRRQPRDLTVLARELNMTVENFQGWLNERESVFSTSSLLAVEKYKKSQKKKKTRGRPPAIKDDAREERLRRIKAYGVDKHCNELWESRKHELASGIALALEDA